MILKDFLYQKPREMALPKEIQDLLDFMDEQEPFEANNRNLSPHLLVETACKWLKVALNRSAQNPRLLNKTDDTADELEKLAKRFRKRKQ